MNFIGTLLNVILHLDKYLNVIMQNYGGFTYVFIFLIIFCETGFVVTPFLPGDSILFATGALAVRGTFNIFTLFIAFYFAAVIGDTVNYHIGKKIGSGILNKKTTRFVNKKYLEKAQNFYDKHGSMTIVIGRFIPIIRTFVPFTAGIGKMDYFKFLLYNAIGGLMWVLIFLGGGYFFGNMPIMKDHFSYILILIMIISILPAIVTFIIEKKSGDRNENIVTNTET